MVGLHVFGGEAIELNALIEDGMCFGIEVSCLAGGAAGAVCDCAGDRGEGKTAKRDIVAKKDRDFVYINGSAPSGPDKRTSSTSSGDVFSEQFRWGRVMEAVGQGADDVKRKVSELNEDAKQSMRLQ